MITIDVQAGLMELDITDTQLNSRAVAGQGSENSRFGMGRELFEMFRHHVNDTEAGGTILKGLGDCR